MPSCPKCARHLFSIQSLSLHSSVEHNLNKNDFSRCSEEKCSPNCEYWLAYRKHLIKFYNSNCFHNHDVSSISEQNIDSHDIYDNQDDKKCDDVLLVEEAILNADLLDYDTSNLKISLLFFAKSYADHTLKRSHVQTISECVFDLLHMYSPKTNKNSVQKYF